MHWAKARFCCAGDDPAVLDEPPEPADETAVPDDPPALDEPPEPADDPPALDEPPEPADEPPALDEPLPHAASSSTMPAVTARTPARRRAREWLLSS
jgi:hypothetical protein